VTELVRELTSPPDTVDEVHGLLDALWVAEPTVTDDDRMRFETALIELATNVVQHADAGDGVAWVVTVTCQPTLLSARLTDTAARASIDADAERQMPHALAEEGRGLAFVRLLVDTATFENTSTGNEWRITKRRGDDQA
jgi:serine/threonine-protein kinase RsbW